MVPPSITQFGPHAFHNNGTASCNAIHSNHRVVDENEIAFWNDIQAKLNINEAEALYSRTQEYEAEGLIARKFIPVRLDVERMREEAGQLEDLWATMVPYYPAHLTTVPTQVDEFKDRCDRMLEDAKSMDFKLDDITQIAKHQSGGQEEWLLEIKLRIENLIKDVEAMLKMVGSAESTPKDKQDSPKDCTGDFVVLQSELGLDSPVPRHNE